MGIHVVMGIIRVGHTTEKIQHLVAQQNQHRDTRIYVICGVAPGGAQEPGNVHRRGQIHDNGIYSRFHKSQAILIPERMRIIFSLLELVWEFLVLFRRFRYFYSSDYS